MNTTTTTPPNSPPNSNHLRNSRLPLLDASPNAPSPFHHFQFQSLQQQLQPVKEEDEDDDRDHPPPSSPYDSSPSYTYDLTDRTGAENHHLAQSESGESESDSNSETNHTFGDYEDQEEEEEEGDDDGSLQLEEEDSLYHGTPKTHEPPPVFASSSASIARTYSSRRQQQQATITPKTPHTPSSSSYHQYYASSSSQQQILQTPSSVLTSRGVGDDQSRNRNNNRSRGGPRPTIPGRMDPETGEWKFGNDAKPLLTPMAATRKNDENYQRQREMGRLRTMQEEGQGDGDIDENEAGLSTDGSTTEEEQGGKQTPQQNHILPSSPSPLPTSSPFPSFHPLSLPPPPTNQPQPVFSPIPNPIVSNQNNDNKPSSRMTIASTTSPPHSPPRDDDDNVEKGEGMDDEDGREGEEEEEEKHWEAKEERQEEEEGDYYSHPNISREEDEETPRQRDGNGDDDERIEEEEEEEETHQSHDDSTKNSSRLNETPNHGSKQQHPTTYRHHSRQTSSGEWDIEGDEDNEVHPFAAEDGDPTVVLSPPAPISPPSASSSEKDRRAENVGGVPMSPSPLAGDAGVFSIHRGDQSGKEDKGGHGADIDDDDAQSDSGLSSSLNSSRDGYEEDEEDTSDRIPLDVSGPLKAFEERERRRKERRSSVVINLPTDGDDGLDGVKRKDEDKATPAAPLGNINPGQETETETDVNTSIESEHDYETENNNDEGIETGSDEGESNQGQDSFSRRHHQASNWQPWRSFHSDLLEPEDIFFARNHGENDYDDDEEEEVGEGCESEYGDIATLYKKASRVVGDQEEQKERERRRASLRLLLASNRDRDKQVDDSLIKGNDDRGCQVGIVGGGRENENGIELGQNEITLQRRLGDEDEVEILCDDGDDDDNSDSDEDEEDEDSDEEEDGEFDEFEKAANQSTGRIDQDGFVFFEGEEPTHNWDLHESELEHQEELEEEKAANESIPRAPSLMITSPTRRLPVSPPHSPTQDPGLLQSPPLVMSGSRRHQQDNDHYQDDFDDYDDWEYDAVDVDDDGEEGAYEEYDDEEGGGGRVENEIDGVIRAWEEEVAEGREDSDDENGPPIDPRRNNLPEFQTPCLPNLTSLGLPSLVSAPPPLRPLSPIPFSPRSATRSSPVESEPSPPIMKPLSPPSQSQSILSPIPISPLSSSPRIPMPYSSQSSPRIPLPYASPPRQETSLPDTDLIGFLSPISGSVQPSQRSSTSEPSHCSNLMDMTSPPPPRLMGSIEANPRKEIPPQRSWQPLQQFNLMELISPPPQKIDEIRHEFHAEEPSTPSKGPPLFERESSSASLVDLSPGTPDRAPEADASSSDELRDSGIGSKAVTEEISQESAASNDVDLEAAEVATNVEEQNITTSPKVSPSSRRRSIAISGITGMRSPFGKREMRSRSATPEVEDSSTSNFRDTDSTSSITSGSAGTSTATLRRRSSRLSDALRFIRESSASPAPEPSEYSRSNATTISEEPEEMVPPPRPFTREQIQEMVYSRPVPTERASEKSPETVGAGDEPGIVRKGSGQSYDQTASSSTIAPTSIKRSAKKGRLSFELQRVREQSASPPTSKVQALDLDTFGIESPRPEEPTVSNAQSSPSPAHRSSQADSEALPQNSLQHPSLAVESQKKQISENATPASTRRPRSATMPVSSSQGKPPASVTSKPAIRRSVSPTPRPIPQGGSAWARGAVRNDNSTPSSETHVQMVSSARQIQAPTANRTRPTSERSKVLPIRRAGVIGEDNHQRPMIGSMPTARAKATLPSAPSNLKPMGGTLRTKSSLVPKTKTSPADKKVLKSTTPTPTPPGLPSKGVSPPSAAFNTSRPVSKSSTLSKVAKPSNAVAFGARVRSSSTAAAHQTAPSTSTGASRSRSATLSHVTSSNNENPDSSISSDVSRSSKSTVSRAYQATSTSSIRGVNSTPDVQPTGSSLTKVRTGGTTRLARPSPSPMIGPASRTVPRAGLPRTQNTTVSTQGSKISKPSIPKSNLPTRIPSSSSIPKPSFSARTASNPIRGTSPARGGQPMRPSTSLGFSPRKPEPMTTSRLSPMPRPQSATKSQPPSAQRTTLLSKVSQGQPSDEASVSSAQAPVAKPSPFKKYVARRAADYNPDGTLKEHLRLEMERREAETAERIRAYEEARREALATEVFGGDQPVPSGSQSMSSAQQREFEDLSPGTAREQAKNVFAKGARTEPAQEERPFSPLMAVSPIKETPKAAPSTRSRKGRAAGTPMPEPTARVTRNRSRSLNAETPATAKSLEHPPQEPQEPPAGEKKGLGDLTDELDWGEPTIKRSTKKSRLDILHEIKLGMLANPTTAQIQKATQNNTTRNAQPVNEHNVVVIHREEKRPPSPSSKIRRVIGFPGTEEQMKAARAERALKRQVLRQSTENARRSSTFGTAVVEDQRSVSSNQAPTGHYFAPGDEPGGFKTPKKKGLKTSSQRTKMVKWDRALVEEQPEKVSSPRTAKQLGPTGPCISRLPQMDGLGNLATLSTLNNPNIPGVKKQVIEISRIIYADDPE